MQASMCCAAMRGSIRISSPSSATASAGPSQWNLRRPAFPSLVRSTASFRRLLLWRGRLVSFVAQAHRVRIAAVACPAGYRLIPHGEDARAGKIRIDLAHQHDHLARDILPRVDVYFLRPPPAVTVVAVHAERIAELAHQRVRTVYVRVRRQQL